jgi:SET domain
MGMTWLWLMPCTKQTMLAGYVTHAALTVKPSELLSLLFLLFLHRLNIILYKCCFYLCQRVTAVDGQYQIGIYATRPISYGEEITFDYNSVTEVFSSWNHFSS